MSHTQIEAQAPSVLRQILRRLRVAFVWFVVITLGSIFALALALLGGVVGFSGLASVATDVARILFWSAPIAFVFSFFYGPFRRR